MRSNKENFKRYFPKTCAQNQSETDADAFILRKQNEAIAKTEFTYGIISDINTIAGLLILKNINWQRSRAELCYCLGSAYQRKGWASKAVRDIGIIANNELGLESLYALIFRDNKASVKVAESNGYIWKRTLVAEYTPPGETALDMELYERPYIDQMG
jgi:ribosomal-protein-alanine N-acetyltransferase